MKKLMGILKTIISSFSSQTVTLTTLDLIKLHKICSPMNTLEFKDINGVQRAWLNPNEQECFNSGWFTEEDFKDWMRGTGKIVKGETPEEKEKFWKYATFLKEYKNGWMIRYNIEYFDLLIEDTAPEKSESFDSRSRTTKIPLKITKTNKEEIIGAIFGYMVRSLTNDFIGVDGNDDYILKRFRDETWGAKITLYKLGCGYFGYSNTPRSILNLAWVPDVVVAKAYYNYLKIKGVELPDFDFIIKYRK